MNNRNGKWWLAVALCCLAPAAFASVPVQNGCTGPNVKNCQPMPEGGSTAIYLLAAGLTCLGAMLLRSKVTKPPQS